MRDIAYIESPLGWTTCGTRNTAGNPACPPFRPRDSIQQVNSKIEDLPFFVLKKRHLPCRLDWRAVLVDATPGDRAAANSSLDGNSVPQKHERVIKKVAGRDPQAYWQGLNAHASRGQMQHVDVQRDTIARATGSV